MKRAIFFVVVALFIAVSSVNFSFGQTKTKTVATKQKLMTKHATGKFEVKVTPLAAEDGVGDPLIGRLSLDKTFTGGMTGTSKGQMLGIGTALKDSGGYVAAERFVGTLDGKKGSFSMQQNGTMQGGKFEMNVVIVPDSGTEELTGISGRMTIKIEGKDHFYDLEYSLPAAKPATK